MTTTLAVFDMSVTPFRYSFRPMAAAAELCGTAV